VARSAVGNAVANVAKRSSLRPQICEQATANPAAAFTAKKLLNAGIIQGHMAIGSTGTHRQHIDLGLPCALAANIPISMVSNITGAAESKFATVGSTSKTFSLTWGSDRADFQLIESTTTAITSPAIAGGQPFSNRDTTSEDIDRQKEHDMKELDTRDLSTFANAAGQPNQPAPGGHAIARQTTGIGETHVLGAQHVAVYRDEQKVLQKLAALAAAAGSDWFYRFPVKKKDGGTDYIEGPSIKLANEVMRVMGNIAVEVRELDVGDSWVIYARATDLEGGSSMERAYRQRKSQSSMRTKDFDRQLDIAFSIGQSKAIRNVICNFLQIYCDYAFDQARHSLIEKIGNDLPAWRERTIQGLARIPVDLKRVERAIGRPSKEWLAPNIAQVVAMMKSIADGMASVEDVFPPLESKPAADDAAKAPAAAGDGGSVNKDG
jgi:hypothetical protein